MSLIAARVRLVAQRLRDQGFTVVEIPGWETRGKGEMRAILGVVCHHTASNRNGGNAPALRIVTHGRRDLQNSLSMWVVGRDGTIYLVAAGVSWHAGDSAWQGDSYLNRIYAGIEAENDGLGEPWSPESDAAQLAICAEMAREFRFSTRKVAEHREVARPTGRKSDRKHYHGPTWRERIARALSTTPTRRTEDDDMTPQQAKQLEDLHRALTSGTLVDQVADRVREKIQPEGGMPLGNEMDLVRRDMRKVGTALEFEAES